MPKVFAIVPAAGQGTRIGDAVPKQYIPIAGKPMMFHSIEALAAVARIASVCVVLSPLDRHWGEHDWSALSSKIEPIFAGGAHRSATVANGLKHLGDRVAKDDWILVHDAARPCITPQLVEQFLDEVADDPIGGLLAMPLADTLKSADEQQRVADLQRRPRERGQLGVTGADVPPLVAGGQPDGRAGHDGEAVRREEPQLGADVGVGDAAAAVVGRAVEAHVRGADLSG